MKPVIIGFIVAVAVLAQPSDRFHALDEVFSDYDVVQLSPSDIDYQVKVLEEPLTIEVDGSQLVFEMEPNSLLSESYRAEATGEGGLRRQLPLPEVETYKGTLIGAPDIRGRFTITEDSFEGVVFFDDWLFIEPAANYLDESEPADMVVYRKSAVTHDEPLTCGASSLHHFDEQGAFKAEIPTPRSTDFTTEYTVELATEADYEYGRRFGSGRNANRQILSVLNRVEGIYERQLNLTFEVTYQHVWETSNDPYRGSSAEVILRRFAEHWDDNYRHEKYDLAHMWTARSSLSNSGLAWLGPVCRNPFTKYGLSKHYSGKGGIVIPAHEIGHGFNAEHPNEVSPRPSGCADTIMWTPGTPDTSLSFCRFSQNEIRSHVTNHNSCLASDAPPPPPPPPPTVTPNAPTNLSADAINSGLVRIEWQDNSTNEIAFGIERTFESPTLGTVWDTVAVIDRNRSTFVDAELEPSTTYQYRVLSYTSTASSAYSNIAAATTPAAGSSEDTPCGPMVVLNIPFTLPSKKKPTFFSGDPRFRVEVPEDATGLLVNLRALNPKDDIDLHVNHGSYTRLVAGFPDADHSSEGDTGNESIYINSASSPPLRPGTYYLSVSLFTIGRQVKAVISAKLEY